MIARRTQRCALNDVADNPYAALLRTMTEHLGHLVDQSADAAASDLTRLGSATKSVVADLQHTDAERLIDHSANWYQALGMPPNLSPEESLASFHLVTEKAKALGYDFRPTMRQLLPRTDPEGWTTADLEALRAYTAGGHQDLNAALRAGDLTPEQQERVAALRTALGKLEPHTGVVERGLNSKRLPPGYLDQWQPGSDVTEAGLTSTTLNPGAFRKFEDVRLRLYSFTGRNIANYSRHEIEWEVLFGPDTTFHVLKRGFDPAVGKLLIQAIERP